LSKRVCVITGSSSGIGAASAILYAQQGWDVCVNFSHDEHPAQLIAEQCRSYGSNVLVEQADVAEDSRCRRLARNVESHFGRCDVLVNNAGTTKFVAFADLEGLSAVDFQQIYAVNVIGAYQMIRALLPLLKLQVGAGIVNVSSIAALLGSGSSLAYVASKGALNALTLGLARALGPDVRVNAVAPGMVDSPWLKNGLGIERFAALKSSYEESSALSSIVSPSDVAETIYWLGAGAAKTTGEVHVVDGGRRVGRA
jgi:NAD(P)-dependent dehydrogenase (short-subunit alcohol dehydrogenase family)